MFASTATGHESVAGNGRRNSVPDGAVALSVFHCLNLARALRICAMSAAEKVPNAGSKIGRLNRREIEITGPLVFGVSFGEAFLRWSTTTAVSSRCFTDTSTAFEAWKLLSARYRLTYSSRVNSLPSRGAT